MGFARRLFQEEIRAQGQTDTAKRIVATLTDVRIHKQRRRTLMMRRTPVGIVVFIPEWLREDSQTVRDFIDEGLAKLGTPNVPHTEEISPEAMRAKVDEWAARLGVQPKRVQFREMYRKWGSCSSLGNITLNSALLRLPLHLGEYVILHELVHMRVFNHGKEFKAMMSQHMPDWKEREAELNRMM